MYRENHMCSTIEQIPYCRTETEKLQYIRQVNNVQVIVSGSSSIERPLEDCTDHILKATYSLAIHKHSVAYSHFIRFTVYFTKVQLHIIWSVYKCIFQTLIHLVVIYISNSHTESLCNLSVLYVGPIILKMSK